MAQKTTLKEFEAVYPKLEEALLDHAKSYKLPEKELEWLKKVSEDIPFQSIAHCYIISLWTSEEERRRGGAHIGRTAKPQNQEHEKLTRCLNRTLRSTLSAENATAACPSPTPPLSSSAAP